LACASLGSGLNARQGFINKSGVFVVEPRYLWAHDFANGLAATDQGFANHTGEVVIPKQPANQGGDFSDGWAAISEAGSIAYVDVTGKVVLRLPYQAAGPFAHDLAPACASDCGPSGSDRTWGYINRAGQFAIKPQFGYRPEPFRNGLALVCFGCTG
jgi:hypothetical protein